MYEIKHSISLNDIRDLRTCIVSHDTTNPTYSSYQNLNYQILINPTNPSYQGSGQHMFGWHMGDMCLGGMGRHQAFMSVQWVWRWTVRGPLLVTKTQL